MESPVVVTGMSGKFPSSDNIHQFMNNLFNKTDLIFENDRRWSQFSQEIPHRSGKINGIDESDFGFFGLTKRAANSMDPGTRIALEKVYEALLDAGHHPFDFQGEKSGVYVTMTTLESEFWTFARKPENAEVMIHCTRSSIRNNICYYFKLNATGTNIDSACSSSIYAIDMANQDIKRGLCDKAIICGTHLCLHPFGTLQFARLGVLSPDGVCRPFDDAANGYTRSEASVVLILERAHTAKRIYAEVVNTKTNCDGFTEQGITFPSSKMQKQLVRELYNDCGVDPNSLALLEAHGTGTVVGDIQELNAVLEIFCERRTKPLPIGSVKSNLGHTEPVSGLSSVIKILIGFESGFIPPNINYSTPRKEIDALKNGKMTVITEKVPWPTEDVYVGINNFGFGGANGHVLLRRNTPTRNLVQCEVPTMVCVSGRTKEAVQELLNSVSKWNTNSDFIKLIHQIYRKRIPNHIHLGYSISYDGIEIERSTSQVSMSTGKLCVVFNSFEKYSSEIHDALKVIPKYAKKIQEIKKATNSLKLHAMGNDKFIIQLILADILRDLRVPDDTQTAGFEIISDFFKNSKSLEETVIELRNIHVLKMKSVNFSDPNTTLLIIGDDASPRRSSKIQLINPNQSDFLNQMLKSLGKLYLRGFAMELDQLYPEVIYPVGRGTPMISPLIKWDHRHYCHFYEYMKEKAKIRNEIVVTVMGKDPNWSYIAGHVVDGINLFPATGYIFLALEALCTSLGKTFSEVNSVIFEDVKFVQAANVPADGTLSLNVNISHGGDSFVILERNLVLVTGNVYCSPSSELQRITTFVENETLFMEQEEIYKEFQIRGYDYRGEFRAIQSYNINTGTSVVSWRGNWVTFLDNMLQTYLLAHLKDNRNLYVPTNIQRIVINRKKHEAFTTLHNNNIPVNVYEDTNLISGGGVEITGLRASVITRKKPIEPILETYKFVPYEGRIEYNLAVRTIIQTILENTNTIKVKSVEVLTDVEEDVAMMPLIQQNLENLPLIQSELKVLSKNEHLDFPGIDIQNSRLNSESGCLIVIASNVNGNENLLSTALRIVRDASGFIISKESKQCQLEKNEKVQVLAMYETEKGNILLLRESSRCVNRIPINVASIDDLSWIKPIQSSMFNNKIILYSKDCSVNGTMGLINCLRKESSGDNISAVIVFGNAPPFNLENDFYKPQLQKNLAINVYKDEKWGCYRHLLLPDVTHVEREHCYVNTITRGDISSLKWFEGSLSTKIPLENGKKLVQVHYSTINFRDVMITSGRLPVDIMTCDRILQERILGVEYSGVLVSDPLKRVMGMLAGGTLSTLVAADPKLLYPVPDDWTLEDAATVPVVYGTVLYAFLTRGKMKKGQSVLIHSGSGGIGQAAINVATHLGCTVFVTVGTTEKQEFIRKHFPSVKHERIGDSRSTSFEQMILQETGGRGVDFILNSLVEEKLEASARCLAYNGTFLEIGKFDLANDNKLGTMLLKKQARYEGVMVDKLFVASDETKIILGKLLKEGIQNGLVKPLVRTTFASDEVHEAFRHMSTGKHIGKVLIKVCDGNIPLKGIPRLSCNPSACYVIIGGLGGFGLELADWLIVRGAKHLVLTSRTGVKHAYQSYRLNIFKSHGVNVVVRNDDVSTEGSCKALLAFAENIGKVEAIFNLAVVLTDALFENQTVETFRTCLIPKAYATRNLDLVSREICPNLKYFAVFSSLSCGRGNVGQTNYGMANSVMERICENRKIEGYPALAVQWGAIGDVGIVAEMKKNHKDVAIGGTLQQNISNCLQVLDLFLNQDEPVVSSMVVANKRKSRVTNLFDTITNIIGVANMKAINVYATFSELGMDSMMAIEIKQVLDRDFEVFLTFQDIRNMTLTKLKELEDNQSNKLLNN